jgi:hypothetical protein
MGCTSGPTAFHEGWTAAQADQGIPVNSIRPLDPNLEGVVIIGLKAKVGNILLPSIAAFNVIAGGLFCWSPLCLLSLLSYF